MRWRGTRGFSSDLLLYSCISIMYKTLPSPLNVLYFSVILPSVWALVGQPVVILVLSLSDCSVLRHTPVSFLFVSVTLLALYPLIIAFS